MFKFLKERIKKAVGAFSEKFKKEEQFEEEKEQEIKEVFKEKEQLDKGAEEQEERLKLAKETEGKRVEGEDKEYEGKGEESRKKGIFAKIKERIAKRQISEKEFNELFWELESGLLENNVAVEVIDKIRLDLKSEIIGKQIKRGEIETIVAGSMKSSIEKLLHFEAKDIIKLVKGKDKMPFVIVFVGTNGSGKTTTIAKIAHMLKKEGFKSLIAAGDTWRAASIQQLEEHGKRIGIAVVKHDYGSDPAAVAFDAVKSAKARKIDVVLIDTAGRQHSNVNLMDEMKKIIRVVKPDLKVYVGEMIAGNDCVDQIRDFDNAVGIDGIILTKADIDEKGGTAISVSYVTKKPILYLGVGQDYNHLEKFDAEKIIKALFG